MIVYFIGINENKINCGNKNYNNKIIKLVVSVDKSDLIELLKAGTDVVDAAKLDGVGIFTYESLLIELRKKKLAEIKEKIGY